ncbi:MAG: hypothetical protein WC775_04175 [Patescibacteria group bacterium]
MLIDFIAQTDIPAVLLAKALTSKTEFDDMLSSDTLLQERLKEIGYVLKLSPGRENELKSKLHDESARAKTVKDKITHRAHVFAVLLTNLLKKMAEKSPENTDLIYNLSQIVFLWDEFIDFDDYQQNKGDVTKIRESVFYRAASGILQNMSDTDVDTLEKLDFHMPAFERAFYKLQIMNGEKRLTADESYVVIETLQNEKLTDPEKVFFLLVVEAALFVKIAEELVVKAKKEELAVFLTTSDLKNAISQVQNLFALSASGLETLLEEKSRILLLEISASIFL